MPVHAALLGDLVVSKAHKIVELANGRILAVHKILQIQRETLF